MKLIKLVLLLFDSKTIELTTQCHVLLVDLEQVKRVGRQILQ
jgi:hypothetical protein